VARHGRLVEKLPGERQRGILYDTLVNTVRSQIPNRTELIHAKITDIATGPEQQTVKLSTGDYLLRQDDGNDFVYSVERANYFDNGYVKK